MLRLTRGRFLAISNARAIVAGFDNNKQVDILGKAPRS